MTRAALLLVLTAPLGAQVFRATADTVVLNVTVTEAEGRFVGGLTSDDFQVFEDGALQQITNFTHEQQPIALSILLDTSTSMEKRLAVAQDAASGFIRRLGDRDVAQVMAFNTLAETLQNFTGDKAALEHAVRVTRAGGSTSLYNAVYTALNDLRRVTARSADQIRRQAIVLLSDGEDTSSLIDDDQVMDSAKRSEVTIYTIALRTKADAPSTGFNQADFVLRSLAQYTGGHAYRVDDVAQLPAIYQQIADELANQYMIGYTSKNPRRDGQWRTIAVRVKRPATSARTKRGYFAPTGGR